MFSTRSPFRRERAIRPLTTQVPAGAPARAIVISHGQPSEPGPAEQALARFAGSVAEHLPGWQVAGATLAGPGALDRAFEAVGQGALIYPMFMTGGWFTSDALRKRLAARGAHVLQPFGQDAGLPGLALEILRAAMAARGWQAEETQVFIAAHGSGRSRRSAEDTRAFADALARQQRFAEIRVGFVEEPPYLADAAAGLNAQAVCLPFFAAAGGHVQDDIPEALQAARFGGVRLAPIGCAEGAPALVARALGRAEVPA